MLAPSHSDELRVLLLPKTSRDAAAIVALLSNAGIHCEVKRCLAEICTELAQEVGAVVLAEEFLLNDADALVDRLKSQPVWSDLPIIVLSRPGTAGQVFGTTVERLGNVTVLERPVRLSTFQGHVQSALRARGRQYQMRDQLELRQRNEEALRRARVQQDLVVQGANVGVWYCKLPFADLEWDATVKAHFHLPADASVSIDTFYERLHADDRDRTRLAIEESITSRGRFDIEYRTVSRDGANTKWIRAIGRAFYDANGEPARFDGITIDVTDRVVGEIALRQSEQRLRAVVEATPDCVKIVAPDGELLFMNPAGVSMLGATSLETLAGACVFELIAPEHRGEWMERHARVQAGDRLNWQFEIIAQDGARRWMETHAVPLQLPNGLVAQLAVTRDITERKREERDRERLLHSERASRSEVERASRMKDEFLATLSHELRNPLSAIMGWSHLLQTGKLSAEDQIEGARVIERNARAQTQIIEDLLDMSRIISGKIRLDVQRIDLANVVRAAIETVGPAAAAKEIRLRSVLDPLACGVSGDPNRLQQVFWNLLSNAVKFTPKGGTVQIVLERVNSHVEVSVIDSGEGIVAEFLPNVFDRFRQADASTTRRHGGLGLGLAIVKQLVELHGGTVAATSAGAGRGATFVVSLPLAVVHAEGTSSRERRHPSVSATPLRFTASEQVAGVRVLIVDDEPDARAMVRRLLEDCQVEVVAAASAAEAFEAFVQWRPDVLVSDIGMPNEDGYSLIRRIRSLPPQEGGLTPAVALTAYARADDRINVVAAGFQHHLAKPVEPAELLTIVASLAGRLDSAR
jgi:PAS domain S-box-containing protein